MGCHSGREKIAGYRNHIKTGAPDGEPQGREGGQSMIPESKEEAIKMVQANVFEDMMKSVS